MTKKLNFDATDADTLAASDFTGAHLYAGSTRLTKTAVASKEALDVYVANPLVVNLDGVYDGATNLDPDNVGLIAHTRAATPADAQQVERMTSAAASSDNVVAANVHGLDVNSFGMLFDGTTWDRALGTGGAAHIHDGGGSLTVDAVDLDIRDLAAASDSVAAWLNDGAGAPIGSTAGALDVNVASMTGTLTVSDAALANTAIDNGEEVITDAATKVVPSDLAARKYLHLYNHGNKIVYLGKQSGLAVANGFPFFPGVYMELRAGAAVGLYGICAAAASCDVRNLQLA